MTQEVRNAIQILRLLSAAIPTLGGPVYYLAFPADQSLELKVLIGCVAFLALAHLLQMLEAPIQFAEKLVRIEARLADLIPASIHNCQSADVYINVFGGFEDDFYAYNPAYQIETGTDSERRQDRLVREVFLPRYRGGCNAHYLFLSPNGDSMTKDLENFRGVMIKLKNEWCRESRDLESLKERVKVRILHNSPNASQQEIYFGHRHGRKTIVHDIRIPGAKHGDTYSYATIENDALYDRSVADFDGNWKGAKEVDVFA